MSIEKWNLLRQLPDTIERASELPTGVYSAIAARLEEALADGSREQLIGMQEQLSVFLKTYLKRADPKVISAVRGAGDADLDTTTAYALGQITFAQLLAGQAGNRRVDDQFSAVIRDNAPIVRVLLERDKTGLELAEATGLRPETISRKLKTLRELGIVDFHRDGTSLFNFLTPAARTVASTLDESMGQDHRGGSAVRRSVAYRHHKLRSHMRHAMTFGLPCSKDTEAQEKVGARR